MTIRTVLNAGLVLALMLILSPSDAQAGRYGVNNTVSITRFFSECSSSGALECNSACIFNDLPAKCQVEAQSYCNQGDTFISASYGGDYPHANCNFTQGQVCYQTNFFIFTGSVDCRGSCNALCEEAEEPEPPPPPYIECYNPVDCLFLYGDPGFGTWECWFNQCILTNSPLVLHLPDYLSPGGGSQSWWKRGFCGLDTPTVCLDWTGDGNVSCTAWFEPGSENAFIVSLSDEDMLGMLGGADVRAEPWRHFFGNVTEGPDGDRPYEHGFAALATYCGQEPGSEVDLSECGSSLFAWDDRDGDGNMDIEELLDFQDLGITALGDVRTTGKKDKCGNTFPAESNAICSRGRCGTVLDVFFQPR